MYNSIELPIWLTSYLADLLSMPILLTTCLGVVRLVKNDNEIVLTPAMLFAAWLYTSFLFEYYLPLQSSIYTGDKLDVVMYGAGSLGFYFLQLKSKSFLKFSKHLF